MSQLHQIDQIEKDVSKQKPFVGGVIDKVGIEDLEIPIKIKHNSEILRLPSHVKAMVSLDREDMRGIHMSRIYLTLHDFLEQEPLTLRTLKALLGRLTASQKGLSNRAYLRFAWNLPVRRKALKSDTLEGWRYYPVFYEGRFSEKEAEEDLIMGFQVTYSSTCPCSAGLARALIQKKFQGDFAKTSDLDKRTVFDWLGREESISATPHAQKSLAGVKLKVKEEKQAFVDLIDEVEEVLGTPVQTAVKKEDEQEFAKLNSENLMFSEDSARRIKALLSNKSWVKDFHIHVKHFESLHPFEVACYMTKGLPGGFSP